MTGLDQLNPSQRQAVMVKDGPLLIFAGAGSGKTRVLTHRIAYLIENGISPFNILAITFTNKASKEMRERVDALIESSNDIWVSTFHSFCVRILRRDIDKIGFDRSFSIYDTDDSNRLLKACVKELNLNEKNNPIRQIKSQIGNFKDEMKNPEDIEDETDDFLMLRYAKIYKLYQKKLKLASALDFDDLIFKTVELFNYHPEILEKYQERFKYIMVDEYQDTNKTQYTLIKLLSRKYKNICVVGDDDQSIYGWRGADIGNILNFEKDFDNTTIIKLEQNYRSTQKILDTANATINNNFRRKQKVLWTANDQGNDAKFFRSETDFDEGFFVSSTINELAKNNYDYSDITILYRTNAQSRIFEDNLVKMNIPYRLFGGVRFYERREIKDILAYLKIINNIKDEIAIKRIINVPRRGIGDTTILRISEYASKNEISFYQALSKLDSIDGIGNRTKKLKEFVIMIDNLIELSKHLPISELLKEVFIATKYMEVLVTEDPEDLDGRIENIQEFSSKVTEYEQNADDTSLQYFLEEVSLVADIDNYDQNQNAVSLMTVHSSKGLEFPCVFIVGLEDGIFPGYRSIMSDDDNSLEEERRLFYVAVTRAKEQLYLTCAKSRMHNGSMNYNSSSRFLAEIENLLEKLNIVAKVKMPKIKDNSMFKPVYQQLPTPKNITLDFDVGDTITQQTYGNGIVTQIIPAGKDYQVTVKFEKYGSKIFMAMLAKLKKV